MPDHVIVVLVKGMSERVCTEVHVENIPDSRSIALTAFKQVKD